MAVSRKAMTEGLSKCGNSDPLSLVLAGDARATFPGGEGMGKRIATPVCGLVRNDTFYSGAPASAMPYVIRRTLEKYLTIH